MGDNNKMKVDSVLQLTPRQQMMSSGAGALMVSLFMTPLDVVKIRLQTQDRLMTKKCFLYSNGIMDHLCAKMNGDPPARALHTAEEICNCKWYNRPKYFNGTLDAIVKISRTEGVTSLWSGLSPTLVLAIPTTMIYFTTYEQLKAMIANQYNKYTELQGGLGSVKRTSPDGSNTDTSMSPVWISLTAGGLARTWAVTVVNPLELVRTKMQSQKMKFYQVRSGIKDLVRTRGIAGLWSGYTATLLRDVPFSALYWPLYEQTKSMFGYESFAVDFASGAVAGSIASTVTLPFDVIKTTKQIEIGERDIMAVHRGVARTNQQIVQDILREQGVKGLFSGLTPRILKVAPACAIMISSYEFFKKFFRTQNLMERNEL
eukprot:TRINITY_DN3555_c0_g1_i13.p1 TRINITY_DN3555_c0_g1~~TRINITY_DN3555_c0_g1_i13.p1  ORF type:complete len:386 (-),score=58.63 TRINITY_DN3555_c0_g1_i13:531-1649(-)